MPVEKKSAVAPTRDLVIPALNADFAFWGMATTQFLGAFNDNLFKQLVLLLAHGITVNDQQPVAMAVFSVPFLLFSGIAGYLSDRYSKRRIIVLSKVAEILVMAAGLAVFLMFSQFGFVGLMVVLFLMGTQSAFFGPGKYGILPEMLRQEDLPRANGIILMTTFLAIICGTAAAGLLSDFSKQGGDLGGADASRLWIASRMCVFIAIAGTITSLAIRRVGPAQPDLRFRKSALAVSKETWVMLRGDRPLCLALIASSVFWLLAGVTQQAVNSLGKKQLLLSDRDTSLLAAAIGVGIAIGALIAGRLSHGRANFRVMRLGAWGMVVFLAVLSIPGPIEGHRWGFWGSLPLLALLGAAAGAFAIPLMVYIQARPPEGQKGRVIAAMNQANFLAIFLSAGIYLLLNWLVVAFDWPRAAIFGLATVIVLPVAIWYRPQGDRGDRVRG